MGVSGGKAPVKKYTRKAKKNTAGSVSAPSKAGSEPSAIVGIGASAGGLEAFTELLRHLPIDTGIGFVLVQHLDPSHPSILPDLLAKATRMPVLSVKDGVRVRPNEVYVIPPNSSLTIVQGVLQLQLRREKHGHRSIDEFFRSLGEDQKNHAIGVVLSGTASDGTLGLEWIKAEGGITFAQDGSARYDSMPRSAIAAGHVDFVLPPAKIAEEIARIGRHPLVLSAGATMSADKASPAESVQTENGYKDILQLLRKATGVDFTNYRANTIRRRIARRTIMHQLPGMTGYATYLRNHSAETEALLQDLLISVTSFFRNPEAFDVLKKEVFPKLLKQHKTDEPLRTWVYGCSTGEEAYSIAMSFMEVAGERGRQAPMQIYATDLNGVAIDKARNALYPKSLAHHLSPERLRRFFVETEAGYRMSKAIREMCVFARQNLMTDPPFSRIDLISCRNVLIYMEPVLQRKIIPMFHYALKSTGFLMLGLSETVGTDTDLFATIDRKYKIYAKKFAPLRANFGMAARELTSQRIPSAIPHNRSEPPGFDPQKEADRILLRNYAPASVLVDSGMEILQVRGSTGAYLEAPTGKATHDVLKMAHKDLKLPLRAAIRQAKMEDRRVQTPTVRLKHNGQHREVRLEVIPVRGDAAHERYFLILFQSAIPSADKAAAEPVRKKTGTQSKGRDESSQIAALQQQLDATKEYSGSLLEQQDAYNEELQSANEEIQSSNEELQSINEELETAKEELESSNEELTTINDELQNRNRQTYQLNADLTNLLTSIRMPVVMVDSQLHVRRFTPAAEKILNLIETDVGRPITDLELKIEIPDVKKLLIEVIDTVTVLEREVQDRQGRWHRVYLGPYKTPENKIDGAVIVMTDIHALKEIEKSLMDARDYAEAIVGTAPSPLMVLDGNLRVHTANDSFYKTFHVSPRDTENRFIYDIGNGQWNIPQLRRLLEEILPGDRRLQGFEVQRDFPVIGAKTIVVNARKLLQKESGEPMILLGIEDITDRKVADAERGLLEKEKALRLAAEEVSHAKDEFLATMSHELRTPLNSILGWANLLNAGHLKEADKTQALESIARNARLQARLIEDLVDVSRIVAGKTRLDLQEIDLAGVVESVIDTLRPTAGAKRIRVVFSAAPAVGPILGDPQRLQQVVWNLLTNAVKFTPPEGRVDVRLEPMGSGAQITVTDNGQGIEAEFMPYLFQRFHQADSSPTRKHGGLGLGLAIVRHLVETHGGNVWAESQGKGQGSTFVVQFPPRAVQPAVSAPELPSTHRLDESELVAASLENARVLVVDDEDDTRILLAAVFEHYHAEVKAAASAAEALTVLAQWKPAVLVCDIAMPDQDGYDLIRQVRKLPPEQGGQIPALALSAYGKEEDRRRAMEAGYQAHLVKPTNPAELVSVVNRLAAQKEAEK